MSGSRIFELMLAFAMGLPVLALGASLALLILTLALRLGGWQ